MQTIESELNQKTIELNSLNEEKASLDSLRDQVKTLTEQLESEKKTSKELQLKNVKLTSLVKIGEDSLKAELKRVDELQNQLKLKNGSAVSTPCLTTNGGANGSNMTGSTASLEPNSNDQTAH